MTLKLRRVVTGHDAQGRSTVLIDTAPAGWNRYAHTLR